MDFYIANKFFNNKRESFTSDNSYTTVNLTSVVVYLVITGISLYAALLSWESNNNLSYGIRFLYAYIAQFFGIWYLLFYLIFKRSKRYS